MYYLLYGSRRESNTVKPQRRNGRVMPSSFSHTLTLAGEQETADFAARLAPLCRAGDILALKGTLGIGKTSLARAFVRSLTAPDEDVPSPTFTLVQIYETAAFPLYHFDLYRLDAADDAIELGIDDAFVDGVSLIEWPERLGVLLPSRHLSLTLQTGDGPDDRRLFMEGNADWSTRLQGFI